jgi:chitin synthase
MVMLSIVAALILTVRAFTSTDWHTDEDALEQVKSIALGESGVLLAALISTFGIYLLASLLYLDPWHMVTSFPQYLVCGHSSRVLG